MNNGIIVDGHHRASDPLSLNEGTVACRVVYEGVSAIQFAILALHVNDEGLNGSATSWHKLRFGCKAFVYRDVMKE
jgi:hypothetical protein